MRMLFTVTGWTPVSFSVNTFRARCVSFHAKYSHMPAVVTLGVSLSTSSSSGGKDGRFSSYDNTSSDKLSVFATFSARKLAREPRTLLIVMGSMFRPSRSSTSSLRQI
jgi:hypothetical protein